MTRRDRLERKLEKRREWAGKAEDRSASAYAGAHRIADGIPFGQPILVGHHSEKHARRDADRIYRGMEKGHDEHKLADHHRSAAAGLAQALDKSIFSDDDDATSALTARIAEREAEREQMKQVNKLYRKGDAAGLAALGLSLDTLREKVAAVGYSCVTAPYAAYELQNIGGRFKADRDRLAQLTREREAHTKAEDAGGMLITRYPEHDVCSVRFAEKPARDILDDLRGANYRFTGGAWVGTLSRLPESVAEMEAPEEPSAPVLEESAAVEPFTVKRVDLFGNVIDTGRTEAELNGFWAEQGQLL
jgi:hypothetical protein